MKTTSHDFANGRYYLVIASNEDAEKLQQFGTPFQKLGGNVFLANIHATPEQFYAEFKTRFDSAVGRLTWIELPTAIVTPAWNEPV